MTTTERAEKMADHLEDYLPLDPTAWKKYLKPYLLANLDEAAREAVESYTRLPVSTRDFDRGYAAAREQAAGICESLHLSTIAKVMRAMSPAASPGGK